MTDPVVRIENLSRRFGRHHALKDVSLSVPRGVVLGLVGQNGAGKTTLLRHILGLLRAQSGAVTVLGLDPVAAPEHVLAEIGYLSEQRDLPQWMRIDELIRYTKAFFPRWDDPLARDLCDQFQLDVGQRIGNLSRGQHARVGLVLALAHRPALLVLDEPSSGLDPLVRRDILEAIVRTVADEGRSVLFSSHLLDEVERLADHLAVIDHGRIVLAGEMETLRGEHLQVTVRAGVTADRMASIPCVVAHHDGGREARLLCRGDEAAIRRALETANVGVIDLRIATLDEIFTGHANQTAA